MIRRSICLWMLAIVMSSCGPAFLGADPPDDPESVFEAFWQSYDRYYAHFELKGIDWDRVYDEYRHQVDDNTTDDELFSILGEMLTMMQDGHIYLVAGDKRAFSHASIRGQRRDFDSQTIDDHYLGDSSRSSGEGNIIYGRIDGDLGYLRINSLSGGTGIGEDIGGWITDVGLVVRELSDSRGLILDLRNNGGGRAYNTKYVAGLFATERRPFLVTRSRNGPEHDDFSEPTRWYVEPNGGQTYDNPVVVLTNRRTFSAAEWLTLALRQFDHVVHIGTHSGGGLAMFLPRELPNGWMHTISVQDTRCPDGRSYERVGVAPHRYVENGEDDSSEGRDTILDEAVRQLRQE